MFVPGENPHVAYEANYGILRHVLASLLPHDQPSLKVSVYVYRNDYASCELSLNVEPFVVITGQFPPPKNKVPLDLVGLKQFFTHGVQLEGGKIEEKGGLVLVGKILMNQRLTGKKVELSDLAVAYRSVFHAGENKAYVSLDPHRDPTLVTVNFGGFLEDTRIGSVVLKADERFKTITCGLDPNSFKDIRQVVRRFVPSFATVGERFLCQKSDHEKRWQGTRFWYYPDSVEVEADMSYEYAVIRRAQFTANAERSRDDYPTREAFEKFKKTQLKPSYRRNINHLNEHYEKYAAAFPELAELSVVARLMGMCIWLERAKCNHIDLDTLLEVELPPCRTPMARNQLMVATLTKVIKSAQIRLSEVQARAVVEYINPVLDQSLDKVFPSNEHLARYLALASGVDKTQSARFLDRAIQKRQLYSGEKSVRKIIHKEDEIGALALYVAGEIDVADPPELTKLDASIRSGKSETKEIERQIKDLSAIMARSNEAHNRNVGRYNRLVDQQRKLAQSVNSKVERYNSQQVVKRSIVQITGGIALEPEEFTVRLVQSSPSLRQLKEVLGTIKRTLGVIGGEGWVRTRSHAGGSSPKHRVLARPWKTEQTHLMKERGLTTATSGSSRRYWRKILQKTAGWRDQVNWGNGRIIERYYDSAKRNINIAEFKAGKLKAHIVGQYDGQDKIVFRKSSRRDLLRPETPPSWWPNGQ
ncbi:MAG: hypothetical protein K8R91_00745 [Phycisphaerae bacterium]|nr:hypothetical protein [Phycisphaerae bacterium]